MKNTVEIKNNKVYKTYSSRMDFLREEKLYKALKGSGLAPELLDSRDGSLEHEYVEGKLFSEMTEAAAGDWDQLRVLFCRLCDWYGKFRSITKTTLGGIRFDKFICTDDRLICIDFENSKPGYIENDIVALLCEMCMKPVPLAEPGVRTASCFMSACLDRLECNPEMISQMLTKSLADECRKNNYEPKYRRLIQVSTLLSSCGVVFAGGSNNLEECASVVRYMPKRLLSVSSEKADGSLSLNDFETVYSSSGLNNTLARICDVQKKTSQAWSFFVTSDMPKIPPVLMDAFFCADKEESAAVIIEARGKLREFPMLINNKKTRVELESALAGGAVSAVDVLVNLPVKVVKLENIK